MFCCFNVSIFDILDEEDKYCLDRQQISFSPSLFISFSTKRLIDDDHQRLEEEEAKECEQREREREKKRKRERIEHWTSYISFSFSHSLRR